MAHMLFAERVVAHESALTLLDATSMHVGNKHTAHGPSANPPGLIHQVREDTPLQGCLILRQVCKDLPQVAPVGGKQDGVQDVRIGLGIGVVVHENIEALGHHVLHLPQEPAGTGI